MKTIIAARLYDFVKPGSMGIVHDTRFIRCFWPRLDYPVAIFAEGSSGIQVQGPPTPRNIVFPKDTVFPEYHPDALYPAEQAVLKAFPGPRTLLNLTDEKVQIYLTAYDKAVKSFPDTHTKHQTRSDCHYITHIDNDQKYIALLSSDEVTSLITEKVSIDDLKTDAIFVKLEQPFDDLDTTYHRLSGTTLVDITADLISLADLSNEIPPLSKIGG